MSVSYGGPTGGYAPPGRVNFGWLNESFDLFKANWVVWVLAVLVSMLVPVVIGAIIGALFGAANAASAGAGGFRRTSPFNSGLPVGVNLMTQAINLVYRAFIAGGLYRIAVKQVRGEPTSVGDVFSGGQYFLPMLGFTILYGLAVGVGVILLIVPGLIVLYLMLPAFALIADGEGVSQAISRSVNGMKGDIWTGIAFILVLGLVMTLSACAFGLGLFVTYPMFWLVSALAYRDMIGMPGMAAPASPYGAGPYGAPPAYTPGVWPPPPGLAPPGQPPPFGQSTPPPAAPPRRTLGGDLLDEDGNNPPPPNPPPGGTPPQ